MSIQLVALRVFREKFRLLRLWSKMKEIFHTMQNLCFLTFHQNYVKKKITPICTKLIFRRLIIKLAIKHKSTISNSFYQQTNECTIGGTLYYLLLLTLLLRLVIFLR